MGKRAVFFLMGSALAASCTGDLGSGAEVVRSDLEPGEVATRGSAAAVVPERGVTVHAEVILSDGTFSTLELETLLDGRVLERIAADEGDDGGATSDGEAEAGATSAALSSSPAPCNDRARSLMGHRWHERYEWRFAAGTTPTGLGKDAVEAALRRAVVNIVRSDNDCGMPDFVSATARYLGRTTRGTNVTRTGACGSRDGQNVVGFGALPTGILGVSCTWSIDGRAIENDVRLNRGDHRWFVRRPSGCTNRFGIEAVMTHELGHTFGLGHVSESTHGHLTMSTRAPPCSNAPSTLGRGDVIGLRALY